MRLLKYICFFTGALLLLSCADAQYSKYPVKQMEHIDALVLSNPTEALRKLDSLNLDTSDTNLRNYYKLNKILANANLLSVGRAGSDIYQYLNLNNIEELYLFYENEYENAKKNYNSKVWQFIDYNYARISLLYGIVRYESKRDDILAYRHLKSAQTFFDTNQKHNHYKAFLYYTLAKVNAFFGNFPVALDYYNNSMALMQQAGDSVHIVRTSLRLANMFYIIGHYEQAESIFTRLEESRYKLGYYEAYQLYLLKAAARASVGDTKNARICFDKAIDVKEFVKENEMDLALENLVTSRYYLCSKIIDSALVYAKRAIDCALSQKSFFLSNINLDFYYRNLGDIYMASGDTESAALNYKEAYNNLLSGVVANSKAVNKGLETAYNYTIDRININNEWRDEWITYILLGLLITLLLIIIMILVFRLRLGVVEKEKTKLQKDMLEKQMYQSKSIIDIVSISLGMLPKFVEKINELSAKTFTTDPKLYEVFQSEITSVKIQTRKHFLDLINNDAFKAANPILQYLDNLSNQEKMIVLLLKQNYSTKYISNVLNTSQSSIRASKVKIKSKIREAEIQQNIKDELLGIIG